MRTKLLLMIFTLVFLIGTAASVSGQAPTTFLYQGRLTDANDQPITASTSVSFAVVSGPSGMVISYYDTTIAVTPDDNGVFTVELGPMPETVFSGSKRYLSVIVGGTELLPRQLITSVPYAANVAGMPGIVHSYDHGPTNLPDSTIAADTLTITVPSAGYVVLFATGYFVYYHAASGDWVRASITDSTTNYIDFTNFAFVNYGVTAAATFHVPFAIQGVYSVDAGTHTYYLTCGRAAAAGSSSSVDRVRFTATFYPNAYGAVSASTVSVPSTGADIGPDGAALTPISNPGEEGW